MRSATGQKFWLSLGLITAIGSPGIGAVEVLVAIGAIALTSTVAQAVTLSNWSFNPSTNQLEVLLPAGVQPRYFLVAEPARIVLDLPSTQVGEVPTEGNYGGAIQQIRVAQFQPDLARIVLQLSPDTVLAPGQVKLEKVGSVEQGAQRWTLRPLVADAPIASGQTQPLAPSPVSPSPITPSPALPRSTISTASSPLSTRSAPSSSATGLPPALPTIASAAPMVAVPESASLPVVSPRAMPIPVEVENAPEVQRDRSEVPASDRPSASDRQATRAAARQARRAAQEARQESPRGDRPSVQQSASQQPPPIAQALPPATFTPPAARTVNVPALNPPTAASPAAPVTLASTSDSIPFGQPLPGSTTGTPPAQPTQEPTIISDRPDDNSPDTATPLLPEISVDSTFNTLIPADTLLSLYYPQETPLKLTNEPQEEVLFLAQNVRDRAGNLLIPIDSQVIGSFESNSEGSQFIARSIRIQGENRPISAESDSLGGDREVASNRVVRNSAAGAAVGLLLGLTTGIGVLAGVALGALSGAGSVFVSAPQAASIELNQVIEVRLLEDLPR